MSTRYDLVSPQVRRQQIENSKKLKALVLENYTQGTFFADTFRKQEEVRQEIKDDIKNSVTLNDKPNKTLSEKRKIQETCRQTDIYCTKFTRRLIIMDEIRDIATATGGS